MHANTFLAAFSLSLLLQGRFIDLSFEVSKPLSFNLSFSTYLSKSFVKQRLRSVSTYLLQASTARGFDRTVVIEADPARSTFCFCISLTMYTPDCSFPWVPPQMATRDSGGKETCSICWTEKRDCYKTFFPLSDVLAGQQV